MSAAADSGYRGVEDLGPAALLAALTDTDRAEREAGRDKLEIAYQWCVLHPATADTGVASWGDPQLPGTLDADESLGGEGTPAVAAFTPEPFAAALGVSTLTGMGLLADALDLVHRHPILWAAVQELAVPAWKARKVVRSAHSLSKEAAAYVDRQLAGRVASAGAAQIDRVVAQAIATFHPEEHARRESRGKESWDVALVHPPAGEFTGTSDLHARGDTWDLTKFHDLVCETAADLAALGDTDPLGVRKANALGALADQQATLDLHTLLGPTTPVVEDVSTSSTTDVSKPRNFEDPAVPAPRLRRPGRRGLDRLDHRGDRRGRAARPRHHGQDPRLARQPERHHPAGAADGPRRRRRALYRACRDEHDPPAWMRDLVILRDRHCRFPWCQHDARACDLDHIDPYDEVSTSSTTERLGQTRPDNLAPLCRRHHRAKTSGRWRYRRRPDGTYQWTAPGGTTYLVTPTGTLTINPN